MDPALHSAVARGLELSLNRALTYDPGSRAALAQLAGRWLKVELRKPQVHLHCGFSTAGIKLFSYREEPADCILAGTAPAVVSLLWREQHSLAGSGVDITGDVSLLHKLQQILANLDLDWEQLLYEAISRATTPAAADLLNYPISRFLRDSAAQIRHHAQVTPDWLQDYLTEEIRLLPSPHEVAAFAAEVDEVRAATDRLEARLRKLHQQLDREKPPLP
jgi:ubiquinone biosynthesis protein UbiJ